MRESSGGYSHIYSRKFRYIHIYSRKFRYSHIYRRKSTEPQVLSLVTKTRRRLGLEWKQTPDSPALGRSTVPIPTAVLGSHPADGHFK
jgi:hypothetical protein